ncbi:MAG: hypothetical protein KAJ55_16245 [Anaerolineales bacterium]|nr:hypothetical protein [Anaerolineales bacterium]
MKSTEEKKKKKEALKEGMQLISTVFDKALTPVLIEIYWKAVEEYSAEKIKLVFQRAALELKFFPKPVELRHFATGSPQEIGLWGHQQAVLVLKQMKNIGHPQSIKFADPVTTAVIARVYGGWQAICTEVTIDQTQWFLKDFQRHYSNFAAAGIKDEKHLPGMIEHQNIATGYLNDIEPVLIGFDEEDDTPKLLQ